MPSIIFIFNVGHLPAIYLKLTLWVEQMSNLPVVHQYPTASSTFFLQNHNLQDTKKSRFTKKNPFRVFTVLHLASKLLELASTVVVTVVTE
jgi:hypothetical protein